MLELFIDCQDYICNYKVVYKILLKLQAFLTQKGRYMEKYFWSKLSLL